MITKTLSTLRRIMLAGAACTMLISCAAIPSNGFAQSRRTIRVAVLGEDGLDTQISRNSTAFHRVVSELQEAMHRRGFEVVDEDMIAADLGWQWNGYRDKRDLMEAAKLANSSETARNRIRAVAVFSIEGLQRNLSFSTKYEILVRGQIYDTQANRFLGSFELPTETTSGPPGCSNMTCASLIVGGRARDIATSLGSVLFRKLARLADRTANGDDDERSGLNSRYTLSLCHFSSAQALQIVSVMAEEFPGYEDHELLRRTADLRKYSYVTTAPSHKIEHWLSLLLLDMGLDLDEEIELVVRDGSIGIEKIYETGKDRKSKKAKYN
jgi:hypothetical protein